MNQAIDITNDQRKTTLELLEKYLPNTTAWVYGSRVKWTSRPQSDLDLVVFATPEQHPKVSDLREAFEESNLLFRVDLFVWDDVPEQFRKEIEAEHVVLVEKEESSFERGSSGAPNRWVKRKIGALGRVVTGKTPSTADSSNFDGPYPFITIPDLDGRVLIDSTKRTLSEKGAAILQSSLLPPGAVLMSCIATVGRCGVTTRPSFTNQQINSVIPGGSIDSRFLYYVFTQLGHRLESAGGGGSVYTNVSKSRFSDIEVVIPFDLTKQRAIAHILGTLDDKIELNRRMNETLEAMARALFKSWFVDFDPVRAKSALKRHKSITPPLRGSRQGKGASPQASRWGAPSRPHSPQREEIKRLYSPLTLKRAKTLRQSRSDAEGLLWHYLSKKQLDGHKFRRQQPIGRYIVDFVCMAEMLVIELDGGQHSTQRAYDEQRDQFLTDQGYQVLRFWNSAVFENCYGVLESILAALRHNPVKGTEYPPPQPADPVSPPPPGGSDWTVERAKAYLERMDPDIADLFPDQLVPSELGEIPEGWEVGIVDQLAEKIQNGGTPKRSEPTYWDTEDIPWLTSGEVRQSFVLDTQNFISRLGLECSSAKMTRARSILVALYGATAGQVSMNILPLSTNQAVTAIIPTDGNRYFCLLSLKSQVGELGNRAVGSAQQNLSKKAVESTIIVLPKIELRRRFDRIVEAFFEQIFQNLDESRALTALRDALLPKLVSGELRMENANFR